MDTNKTPMQKNLDAEIKELSALLMTARDKVVHINQFYADEKGFLTIMFDEKLPNGFLLNINLDKCIF